MMLLRQLLIIFATSAATLIDAAEAAYDTIRSDDAPMVPCLFSHYY